MLPALFNALRGALIGVVEVIPGVSGGTVALIIGIYEDLIDSAGHLARGVVRAVLDVPRGRGAGAALGHLRQVKWRVVLPAGIGMLGAVVAAAAVLSPLLEEHPVATRALFTGLIAASIAVPVRMVGRRWRGSEVVLAVVAAVVAFVLTGLPRLESADPALPLVALAAAVAVCALVVPGLSGSFLLLVLGLYAPTLAAVNDRDLVYLGVFVLGAVLGLGAFVSALQWLLAERRGPTLAVMTGLMAGSLRALWPWQTEDGTALAPTGDLTVPITMVVVGLVVVVAMLVAESAVASRATRTAAEPDTIGV
ncbi:DUF368 domain-containing protein [Georgenia sp. MJ173]|uniref:DUF368 domain-containing protein n=1 Tax=Georgenia sunbinii TaxID=3117728 RepID=UPI002F261EC2